MERFDFSDPQGGKGEADRQAAAIKGHINVYLNEGHDVNNAAQMNEAMESNGGIPGVIVKYVKLPEASSDKIMVKWDRISALKNFQFEERGKRVWKAYKIGPGKLVPWKDIQSDGSSPIVLEVLESPVQNPQSSFKIINQDKRPNKQIQLLPLRKTQPQKAWKMKKRKLRLTVCLLVQKMAAFGHFSSPRVYRLI